MLSSRTLPFKGCHPCPKLLQGDQRHPDRPSSVVPAISVENGGNLRVVYARIGRCQGRPAWRGAQAAVARPYPAVTCHVGVNGGRAIAPVTRATIVLIEVGSCDRTLWTRPKPTTSVTKENASITTFRCVRRLAASSEKLFITRSPKTSLSLVMHPGIGVKFGIRAETTLA